MKTLLFGRCVRALLFFAVVIYAFILERYLPIAIVVLVYGILEYIIARVHDNTKMLQEILDNQNGDK